MSVIGKAVSELAAGSRVGVGVDVGRRLHLLVNGEYEGVISPRALPHPCHALFVVHNGHRKVSQATPRAGHSISRRG